MISFCAKLLLPVAVSCKLYTDTCNLLQCILKCIILYILSLLTHHLSDLARVAQIYENLNDYI